MHGQVAISNEKEFQQWLQKALAHERERLAAEIDSRDSAGRSSPRNDKFANGRIIEFRGRQGMNSNTSHGFAVRLSRFAMVIAGLLTACIWQSADVVQAQTPNQITAASTPKAMTTNNTGSNSTYVLNADSSINVLQNTGLVSGGGCGPILPNGETVYTAALCLRSLQQQALCGNRSGFILGQFQRGYAAYLCHLQWQRNVYAGRDAATGDHECGKRGIGLGHETRECLRAFVL